MHVKRMMALGENCKTCITGTLASNISDGGAGVPLSLTDVGTLVSSGTANSYTGGTYVNQAR